MSPAVLLQVEWIKLLRRPAAWVVFCLFIFFSGIALFGSMAVAAGEAGGLAPLDWRTIVSLLSSQATIFLAIAMILLVASEFTWKTTRQNVIDGLSRGEFIAGKMLLAVMLALIFFAGLLLIGMLSRALVSASLRFGTSELQLFGGHFCALLGTASLALLFAVWARSGGAGVALYLIYIVVVENLAGLAASRWEATADLRHYLPMQVFNELADPSRYGYSVADLGSAVATVNIASTELIYFLTFAYIAAFSAAAYLIFRYRDL